MKTKVYTADSNSGRMHVSSAPYFLVFVILITIVSSIRSFAQEESEYFETSVFIDVPKVGGGEIDAVLKGEDVYLPVTDLKL